MANKLIEQQLTKIEAVLKASLATELATLQAAYADGITLTAPVTNDNGYSIYELSAIDQLPFIEILPDTSPVILTGIQHDEMDHHIIIVAHTDGKEGRTDYCAKRTYRFAEAIWRLLTTKRTLDDTVIEAFITDINYKPMMTDDYSLKGEVWIHVTVKDEERI